MSKTILYLKGNGFLHIPSHSSSVLIHFSSFSSHILTYCQTTLIHISFQQLHLTVGCIYQRPDCILIHIAIKSCFLSEDFVCLFVFSFPYLLVFLVFLLPVQFTLVWSLNYPYFSCMFSIFLVFIFLLINSIPHHSITPFSLFNSCSLNCKPDFSFSCISFLLESKI